MAGAPDAGRTAGRRARRRRGPPAIQALDASAEACWAAGKTRWSPKEFLSPRTETLFSYRAQGDTVRLDERPADTTEQVLVGVRPCDAAGLARLDEVLGGPGGDPLYAALRRRTAVVSLACAEAGPECFCTAVGGGPGATEGSDVRLFPALDGWIAVPVTATGAALAASLEDGGRARAATSALAPVSNWLLSVPGAKLVAERVLRIHRARALPAFVRPTFPDWFRRHTPAGDGRRGPVLLFHDTFMDHNYPSTGIAATELLERAGCRVELADQVCCGRPMISKGLVEQAAGQARANVTRLHEPARRGQHLGAGARQPEQLEALDASCCGMAGSYGYEREHYAASRAACERAVAPAVRAAAGAEVAVMGPSCRQQIAHVTGRQPRHVVGRSGEG